MQTPTADGSQHGDAGTEAEDGALLSGAESFWPSVDTDDSDAVTEHVAGSPVRRQVPTPGACAETLGCHL